MPVIPIIPTAVGGGARKSRSYPATATIAVAGAVRGVAVAVGPDPA